MSNRNQTAIYASESEMCADFIQEIQHRGEWKAYAETAGFDILLVRVEDGAQIGIEAKLALNAKVIAQALPGWRWDAVVEGPDYRAVLVPHYAGGDFEPIISALGLGLLRQRRPEKKWALWHRLPTTWNDFDGWYPWNPDRRCKLPDFVPDVAAGASAPLRLTDWKVKAIKLSILLEEGPVTRADMQALRLDPGRWTDKFSGWLDPVPGGYARSDRTPDFKAQHPRVYEEIKASRVDWQPARQLGLAKSGVSA